MPTTSIDLAFYPYHCERMKIPKSWLDAWLKNDLR